MPPEEFDEVGDRNTEHRAGQVFIEAGHESGDEAPQRQPVDPDRGVGFLLPDPAQHAPDIPDGVGRGVDVVEHVFTGEHGAFGQPFRAGTV